MLGVQRLQMMNGAQNEDLMNPVEVYRDFKLVAKCPTVESFRWNRRFSRPGDFMLTTSFSPEKLDIYREGSVIYKRDVDEAAFVERRTVMQTLDTDMRLLVEGRFVSSLLDRRDVTLAGNFSLTNLLNSVISNNFLAGAGSLRSMANVVRLLPINLGTAGTSAVSVDYSRQNVLSVLEDLLQESNVGLRTHYNIANRSFDISFYAPRDTVVVFDKEFGNILEQDYWDDTTNFKNVVFVGDNMVYNNHISGFNRREISVAAPRAGSEHPTQTARDTLNRQRSIRTISSTIDVNSLQFEYMKDWDVGCRVLSQNREIGFADKEIITEIMEFFDYSGKNVEVNMGDYRVWG